MLQQLPSDLLIAALCFIEPPQIAQGCQCVSKRWRRHGAEARRVVAAQRKQAWLHGTLTAARLPHRALAGHFQLRCCMAEHREQAQRSSLGAIDGGGLGLRAGDGCDDDGDGDGDEGVPAAGGGEAEYSIFAVGKRFNRHSGPARIQRLRLRSGAGGAPAAPTHAYDADFAVHCMHAAHSYLAVGGAGGRGALLRLDDDEGEDDEVLFDGVLATSAINSVRVVAVSASRGAARQPTLVVCSNDSFVRAWTLPTMRPAWALAFPGHPNASSLSPDGLHLVVAGDENVILYINAATRRRRGDRASDGEHDATSSSGPEEGQWYGLSPPRRDPHLFPGAAWYGPADSTGTGGTHAEHTTQVGPRGFGGSPFEVLAVFEAGADGVQSHPHPGHGFDVDWSADSAYFAVAARGGVCVYHCEASVAINEPIAVIRFPPKLLRRPGKSCSDSDRAPGVTSTANPSTNVASGALHGAGVEVSNVPATLGPAEGGAAQRRNPWASSAALALLTGAPYGSVRFTSEPELLVSTFGRFVGVSDPTNWEATRFVDCVAVLDDLHAHGQDSGGDECSKYKVQGLAPSSCNPRMSRNGNSALVGVAELELSTTSLDDSDIVNSWGSGITGLAATAWASDVVVGFTRGIGVLRCRCDD